MNPFLDFFQVVVDFNFICELLAMSFSVAFVLRPPKNEKKSILFFLLEIAILFVGGLSTNLIFFCLAKPLTFLGGFNFPLSYLVTIALFTIFVSKYNLKSKIVMASVLYATDIVINEFSSQFMRVVGVNNAIIDYLKLPFVLLIVALAFVMRKLTMHHFHDMPTVAVVLVLINCIVPVFFVYFYIYYGLYNTINDREVGVVVLLLLYILIIASYLSVYFVCRERERVIVLKSEKRMLEADKKMMEITSQSFEDMRKARHDFKNQIATMNFLLQKKDYETLEKYFNELSDTVLPAISLFSCSNKGITTILNIEKYKARNKNIPLDIHVAIPNTLPFSDYDLCSLLSNMIDNAMESMEREQIEGSITIDISLKGSGLYVCVTNPIKEENREHILSLNTTKNDNANHGLGHLIIKNICEKYHGYASFSIESNQFMAIALLETTEG